MCCEYAALRLLFAGSYSYSAGQVPEGFRRIRGLSDGLTQGRQVSFLCLYMTRLALYFLGSRISSASIHYMTDTWVLRVTIWISSKRTHTSLLDDGLAFIRITEKTNFPT
jgi:hypothetical protein